MYIYLQNLMNICRSCLEIHSLPPSPPAFQQTFFTVSCSLPSFPFPLFPSSFFSSHKPYVLYFEPAHAFSAQSSRAWGTTGTNPLRLAPHHISAWRPDSHPVPKS